MSNEPENAEEEVISYDKERYTGVLQQLELQSRELGEGGHPDIGIRNFNAAMHQILRSEEESDLSGVIKDTLKKRTHIDPTHFVDLLARSMQYTLRRNGITDYAAYDGDQWADTIQKIASSPIQREMLSQQLETRSVATHVVERYRGLTAVLSAMGGPLRVADIGCSRNLGLPACLEHELLLGDSTGNGNNLTDNTPGNVVEQLIRARNFTFSRAVGVDKQDLRTGDGLDWVTACAYFTKFNIVQDTYRRIQERANGSHAIVQTRVADMTQGNVQELVATLQGETQRPLDIMHSSMMLYQLSDIHQGQVLHTVNESLREGGLFVELTFDNSENWFGKIGNIVTTVRQKQDGHLSQPLTWIRWDNSRCRIAEPGEHFVEVNQSLNLS
ncbi:hypothetical protein ACFL1P_00405 [Patescibacteria group bacterium]